MNKTIKQGVRMGTCMLLLTSTACSQGVVERPASEVVETAGKIYPVQVGDNQAGAPQSSESVDQQVQGAIADLAARSGIAKDAISVSQARSVNWGSSALGCPQDGMMYTQALVPGVLVILEADEVFYRYHGRSTSKLIYCPAERAEEPAYGPGQALM